MGSGVSARYSIPVRNRLRFSVRISDIAVCYLPSDEAGKKVGLGVRLIDKE